MRAAAAFALAGVLTAGVAPAVDMCLAVPNRSPGDLGYALSIVCDPSKVDCAPIGVNGSMYWPNTIYHHCNWAFNKYWTTMGNHSEKFCTSGGGQQPGVPAGQAKVYECAGICKVCQIKNDTKPADADAVIGYLCNGTPQILGPLCAPINKGGKMENATSVEKASYVANEYYQGLSCDLGDSACDFSGHGEVVPCP